MLSTPTALLTFNLRQMDVYKEVDSFRAQTVHNSVMQTQAIYVYVYMYVSHPPSYPHH